MRSKRFERAEKENRENVGTVRIWGMAAAVSLISCGKIANGMLKSRSKDKNATYIFDVPEPVGSPAVLYK